MFSCIWTCHREEMRSLLLEEDLSDNYSLYLNQAPFALKRCWEFLLHPVWQCKTGDNVSTGGINSPQLRAEIKAICESGTTQHQCFATALREQRRRVYLDNIQTQVTVVDCFVYKSRTLWHMGDMGDWQHRLSQLDIITVGLMFHHGSDVYWSPI